jgi:hypothetical protein
MNDHPNLPLDAEGRAQMKRWLDTWARVGPLLEAERWTRVRALTDSEAAADALDLWHFAAPGRGDDGEGLLVLKRLPVPRT